MQKHGGDLEYDHYVFQVDLTGNQGVGSFARRLFATLLGA